MRSLAVAVPGSVQTYSVSIGAHLLGAAAQFLRPWLPHQIIIVSSPRIASLYLEPLRTSLIAAQASVRYLEIPEGEAGKNWETLHVVLNQLLHWQLDRQGVLIALGGGSVSDLVGLAASLYQRGIAWIACPTTLLAQVDAAIGGKTAINHALGKNMLGTFWQPSGVLVDLCTLQTLPDREFRAGLAEALKYGLIRDLAFFAWGEQHLETILRKDLQVLSTLVALSCQHKIDLVMQDVGDRQQRQLLNLGHTFGHAIEAGLNYQDCLHGEAVATGIVLAARLSQKLGWLSSGDVSRITRLWERLGLPVAPPSAISASRYRELMANDKKKSGTQLKLILLRQLGQAEIVDAFPEHLLMEVLEECASVPLTNPPLNY